MSEPARNATPPTSPVAPDVERLYVWLFAKIRAFAFGELVTVIITLVVRMRDLNSELARKIGDLRRGRPPSEKLRRVEAQLSLGFEDPALVAPKLPSDEGDKPKGRGKGGGRKKHPREWPRKIVENRVPEHARSCPICGREMKTVGWQSCEKVELRPAEIFIEERRDERVACPHDDAIVSAQKPGEIVERGALGTVLIVESACDKFLEHMPIERQVRRFLRMRVNMTPRTLGRAVCALADLCEPIAKAINERTRASAILATDATSLPILDRTHDDGIRSGTVWVCIGDARWISFVYAPSGESAHLEDFLEDEFRRVMQCDGASTLNFIERGGGSRPGCWAHARRRFVAAARAGDTLALEALRTIAMLFAIERTSAEAGESAAERAVRRKRDAPPVLAELQGWVDKYRGLIPPRSTLGKALGYVRRQWPRLILFLEDGRIELTNNQSERELRRLVLGRKNWLFASHDIGGVRAATMLTIIGTALAHGLRPRQYLHEIVKRLLDGWPQAKIAELLPDRIGAMTPELRAVAVADGCDLIAAA
jgi:transposase